MLTLVLSLGLLGGMLSLPQVAAATPTFASDEVATVSSPAAPSSKPKSNLWLQFHAGPNSPLSEATVTVTNKAGKVVGKGTANKAGTVILHVSPGVSKTNPYLVRTSGGTVRSKDFGGHLELQLTKLGMRQGAQFVDLVTTVAVRYARAYGGTPAKLEGRVFRKLDVPPHDHGFLTVPTYQVHAPALEGYQRTHDGFDGMVTRLVRLMKQGRPFPDFGTMHIEPFDNVSARANSSSPYSNAACQAQTLPSPVANSPATVGVYGAMMTAGLVSAFATKDPSLLLNGVAGMVFSNTPGMTSASMLSSVQAQLQCISQQISTVFKTLSLQMSVQDAATCGSNYVKPTWDNYYQPLLNAAANNPDDTVHYGLTNPDTNTSLQPAMDQIKAMNTACGDAINSGLFNSQGGVQPAWPTVLAQAEAASPAAFKPAELAQLQQFLQYWGTLEYEQSVMMNDWFNYQATVIGKPQTTLQDASVGGNCQKAPSLSDVAANQDASNWCQWQQNIVDVWPGDIYSDEVADWDLNPVPSNSPYAVSGSAVSAVPGGWGNSTTAWAEDPRGLTPAALKENDLPNSTWNVANALATYNNQPAQVLTPPYQRYDYRAAPKTFAPKRSDLDGYNNFHSFFDGALGATITDDTATPCTDDCPEWTLIAADGKTELDWGNSMEACHDQQNTQNFDWYYNYRYLHNWVTSPSPWKTAAGDTYIGGEESSTAHNGSNVCSNRVPPFAWLLGRPWTQGASWPAVPKVTAPSAVPANAQLTASGCPDSGCTWAITSGAIPGLTISSSGLLNYTGTSTSKTANITVAAMNTYQASLDQAITVNLTQFLPVVTTSGQVPRNTQLAADHCPTSGCTWTLTGDVPAGISVSTTGVISYAGDAGGVVAIHPVATNSVGSSQPGYVEVDLTSVAPTVLNPGIYARNGLLIASGGGGAMTWKLLSTTVSGVNVNSMGYVVVSGSPSASTATIVVTATDSYGQTSPPATLTVSTRTYAPIITSSGTIHYGNGAKLTASGCPSSGCVWSFYGYSQTGQPYALPPNDVVLYADGTLKYTGSGGVPTVKVAVITSTAFPNGIVSTPVVLTLTL